MSKNLFQVFTTNPIVTNAATDLMYFGQSPYGVGNDAGMTFANFSAQFGAPYTAAALTKADDTNVTLTLGGTPATALLHAASITAGWAGQLAVGRGGTGNSTFTAFSVICAGTTATGAFQNVSGLGTSGQVLTSQGAGLLPMWAAIPAPAAVTSLSAGTGITLTPSPITTTGSIALTVPVTEVLGGTNQTTYTLGDTLYSSAANTLSKLPGNTTAAIQYLSQTGTGAVSAAPAWATISGGDITGAALTAGNDTNVTLTTGGTPATSLLRAASITAGWTGQLSLARGGTNASLTASNGGIFYSTATAGAILAGTSTASQVLLSGATAAPTWSTATYPATAGTSGNVITSNGTNFVSSAPAAASTTVITDDTTTNATMYPTWVTASTGSLPLKVSSTKLSFNPSTAALTLTGSINGLTGTISAPTAIASSSSANILAFNYTASAVNYLTTQNAATGGTPGMYAAGSDSVISFYIAPKSGNVNIVDVLNSVAPILKIFNAAATHGTGLQVATAQSTDVTFTLPAAFPAVNNAPMVSTTAGVLSFSTVAYPANPPITQVNVQVFTASGSNTYTPTTGTKYAWVELWGAGGGGGASSSATIPGASGGGGAYSAAIVSNPTTVTISIGTGGNGQAANNGTAGTNGGNTTYNSTTVIAAGGSFGSNNTGGAGGTIAGSTGTKKIAGGNGSDAPGIASLFISGGASPGLTNNFIYSGATHNGAANTGQGGGSGYSAGAGGAGGSGYAVVTEYISV